MVSNHRQPRGASRKARRQTIRCIMCFIELTSRKRLTLCVVVASLLLSGSPLAGESSSDAHDSPSAIPLESCQRWYFELGGEAQSYDLIIVEVLAHPGCGRLVQIVAAAPSGDRVGLCVREEFFRQGVSELAGYASISPEIAQGICLTSAATPDCTDPPGKSLGEAVRRLDALRYLD